MNKNIVLIVEDEEGHWMRVKLDLRSMTDIRLKPIRVKNAIEAEVKYKEFLLVENEPRIILVDQRLMDEKTGVDFIKTLTDKYKNNIPVMILSTADGSDPYDKFGSDKTLFGLSEIDAAEKVGALAWIQKGGNLKEKITQVHKDYVDGGKTKFGNY